MILTDMWVIGRLYYPTATPHCLGQWKSENILKDTSFRQSGLLEVPSTAQCQCTAHMALHMCNKKKLVHLGFKSGVVQVSKQNPKVHLQQAGVYTDH